MSNSTTRFLCVLTLAFGLSGTALAQSQEKKQDTKEEKAEKTESFGEFVEKVGKGIWSRLNERFNLESAGKNLVDKKDKILSPLRKKEEVPKTSPQSKDSDNKPDPEPDKNK